MLSFLPRRGTFAAILGAVAVSFALVVPVSAAATINRFTETTTSYIDVVDDCTGATGILTEVAVFDGQSVETSTGFHFEGTITTTGSFAFPDGSYANGPGKNKISFTSAPGVDVFTLVHMDSVTAYSADGQVLWSATFRQVEHFTVTSDGTVRVEFEIGHVRGGC